MTVVETTVMPSRLNVAVVACDGPVDVLTDQLEAVWLPRLGPTSSLVWRLLVAHGTGVLSVNVFARRLGVTTRTLRGSLERLEKFGLAHLSPQGDELCVAIAAHGSDRPPRRRGTGAAR